VRARCWCSSQVRTPDRPRLVVGLESTRTSPRVLVGDGARSPSSAYPGRPLALSSAPAAKPPARGIRARSRRSLLRLLDHARPCGAVIAPHSFELGERTAGAFPSPPCGAENGLRTVCGWGPGDETYLTEIPAKCIKTYRAAGKLRLEAGQHTGKVVGLQESAPDVEGCKGWDGSYGDPGTDTGRRIWDRTPTRARPPTASVWSARTPIPTARRSYGGSSRSSACAGRGRLHRRPVPSGRPAPAETWIRTSTQIPCKVCG
jgi:hypothetical protein